MAESQARKLQKGAKAVTEGLFEELRRHAEAKGDVKNPGSPAEQEPINTTAVANDASASADKIADENSETIVPEAATTVSETTASTAVAATSITATTIIDFTSKESPEVEIVDNTVTAELVDNTVTAELIDNTVTPLKTQSIPAVAASAAATVASVTIPKEVSSPTNTAQMKTSTAIPPHGASTSTVALEEVG